MRGISGTVSLIAGPPTTSAARTITVTTNQAPTVSLTAPAAGASYIAPAAITLTATAADTDGTIAKVEFFQGATLIGTATSAPYSVTWNSVPTGSYSLTAKATDNQGTATTSAARTITVNATNTPPTVSLTAPADGAVYTLPATVTMSATANGVEVDTPITRVDFYQGTTLIGGSTASPYTISWTPMTAGSYSLTAKATDSASGVTTSTARTVTVQAGNQAPNVSLTSPLANQSVTAPASVTLSATASDADGSVAKVEFFQGATLIGSATVPPYSAVWSNVPVGSYSLTAKATDNLGATRSSAAVPITVTGSGPTVLYLHGDHLGTPRVATNEANVVVWRHLPTGEPFGMALPEEDPDGDGRATVINLRFPGQYFDRETPLHYNYFRDYDPGTGRYVQSDPIGLQGGISTYSYVGGNLLGYVDPMGLASCRWFGVVLVCETGQPPVAASTGNSDLDDALGRGNGASSGNSSGAGEACPPRPGNQDPCKGLRDQLRKHQRKLQDYIDNPSSMDNDGRLAGAHAAGDMAQLQNIISGRVRNPQGQIESFQRQLNECEKRYGKP